MAEPDELASAPADVPRSRASASVLPSDVLARVLCCVAPPAGLLAAGVVARAWLELVRRSEAWRGHFARRWARRQKTFLVRPWWEELEAEGDADAELPGLTITAAEPRRVALPPSASAAAAATVAQLTARLAAAAAGAAAGSEDVWFLRFLLAEVDARLPRLRGESELCDDSCMDPRKGPAARFPRRWVLGGGAYSEEFLGDELCFVDGGWVEPRNCLLALGASPSARWGWRLARDGASVDLATVPAEGGGGQASVSISLAVERSSDAGFLLRGPAGLLLRSREKTREEHCYRQYGVLQYPPPLRRFLVDFATRGGTSVAHRFPASLTSFERLAVHRLAETLGLRHDSRGFGLDRQIAVWKVDAMSDSEEDITG
eukprot:TRINITY_DN7462_c0_g1_i1.p1 TRINITY_DN7462_c0_g1~~TRINITY_DN7462_c0_g1_i1.p1  ORF type:complete len:374 (+),score=91.18 TRINITY_DN7462_c0_g1_i1:81-1202(+)